MCRDHTKTVHLTDNCYSADTYLLYACIYIHTYTQRWWYMYMVCSFIRANSNNTLEHSIYSESETSFELFFRHNHTIITPFSLIVPHCFSTDANVIIETCEKLTASETNLPTQNSIQLKYKNKNEETDKAQFDITELRVSKMDIFRSLFRPAKRAHWTEFTLKDVFQLQWCISYQFKIDTFLGSPLLYAE